MITELVRKLIGYVVLDLRGRTELFINEAVAAGFRIWEIRRKSPEIVELKLALPDFFRMKPYLRRTGCRFHVTGRFGFPFVLDRLGKRKAFVIGAAGFVAGLVLLTSLVWSIQVEGNVKLKKEDILAAARSSGIRELQWTFRLKDSDTLSRELQGKLPGTAWVGVERKGTHVKIKIVESVKPDDRELVSPRHLVAKKDALVTKVLAEKGQVLVRPQQYVRKGTVLVSGRLGDETSSSLVPAAGKVFGLVWYESRIEVPLEQVRRTYTGQSYQKKYLVVGNRALQLWGYGKKEYPQSAATADRKTLSFRDWTIPVGWLNETIREVHDEVAILDVRSAETLGLRRAAEQLIRKAGEGARMTEAKIISSKTAEGKQIITAHIEIEEEISEELPVVEAPPAPEAPPGT